MSSEEVAGSLPTQEMQSLAIEVSTSPSTTTDQASASASNSNTVAGAAEPATAEAAQSTKIDILLNATGNVPIMKRRKWTVEPEKRISWIISFIHKYLKLDPEDKIFLYVNQTFAPSPEQTVKNLYDCYESNGRLVLYYCKSQAWG